MGDLMVKNSSPVAIALTNDSSPVEVVPKRRLYFINEQVEWLLTRYIWTGCTEVELRDQIMSNASELIRQIIRKQGLHTIYPGQEESSFGDLLNTAWCQIEKTLYKYRSCAHCRSCFNPDRPNDSILYAPAEREYGIKTLAEIMRLCKQCKKCGSKFRTVPIIEPEQGTYGGSSTILFRGRSKVFNMWSQVARTVILAYIKKEGRDRKNSSTYMMHVGNRRIGQSDAMVRFINEAREMCKYHDDFLKVIDTFESLIDNDDRPYDGIISKLTTNGNIPRTTVITFLQFIKLRSHDFSDSPINCSESLRREYKVQQNEQEE
jgi:hypothetical protein